MNRFNLIDVEGNLLLPNSYAYVRATTLDRVVFRTDEGLEGLLDAKTGQILLQPRFTVIQPFRSEISTAGDPQTGKYGLVHAVHGPFGNWQFCDLSSFVDGLAVAWERKDERGTRDNRIGFINEAGEWVIAPIYQSVEQFRDGRAIVGGPERGTTAISTVTGSWSFRCSIFTLRDLVRDSQTHRMRNGLDS
ncbi:MAG: WG repeat-containing protein [Planctomycetaceae bacterium]